MPKHCTYQSLEQAKTTKNQPKWAEVNWNDPPKLQSNLKPPKNFKIGEIWDFLLAFVFQILNPAKKYQLSNLNKILPASYFEGADFCNLTFD